MAGDWIAWVKGLTKRREVIVMAEALGMPRREVAACCMEWWEWCDSEGDFDPSRDCHVPGVTFVTGLSLIDEHVGVTNFGQAMADCGWAAADGDGDLMHPKLGEWTGSAAKERLRANRRKQKQRGVSRSDRDKTRDKCVTREENRREEKSTEQRSDHLDSASKKARAFVPPSVEEVAEYVATRTIKIDPEKFVDHYEARGWKVKGGGKVVDWKACVRTWEKNEREGQSVQTKTGNTLRPRSPAREIAWNPDGSGLPPDSSPGGAAPA